MPNYAISDIHGCSKTFKKLLKKIELSKKDTLFLLGDYINKGPNSFEVIEHIRKLQSKGFDLRCLRGNHEELLLEDLDGITRRQGVSKNLLKSYAILDKSKLPKEHIKWMRDLSYYFEHEHFILVHAGLDFSLKNPLKGKQAMLWEKGWYSGIDKKWLNGRTIIHGHSPSRRQFIKGQLKNPSKAKAINIDNGCALPYKDFGRLCCFNLDSYELSFQKNKDIKWI